METLEVEVAMEDLPIYDSCCIVGIGPTLVCPNPPDPTERHHPIISMFENRISLTNHQISDSNIGNTSAETHGDESKLRRGNFIEIEVKHYSFEDGILVEKVGNIDIDDFSYLKDCKSNRRRSEELEALKDMKLQLSSLFVNNLDEMKYSKDQSLASPSEFEINEDDRLHLESKSNSMSNDILSATVDSLSDEVFESESQTEARKEMLMFVLHRTKAKSNICVGEIDESDDSNLKVNQDSCDEKASQVGSSNKYSDVSNTCTETNDGRETELNLECCTFDDVTGCLNPDSEARPIDDHVNFSRSFDSPSTYITSSTESGSYSLYSLFDSESEVDRKEEIIIVTRRESFTYGSVKTYELNPYLEASSFDESANNAAKDNDSYNSEVEVIAEEETNEVCIRPDAICADITSDCSSTLIHRYDAEDDSINTEIISKVENDLNENIEFGCGNLPERKNVAVDLEICVRVDIDSPSMEHLQESSKESSGQNENEFIDVPSSKDYDFSAYDMMLKEKGLQNYPYIEDVQKGTAEQIAKQIVQSVIFASQKKVAATAEKALNKRSECVPDGGCIKNDYNLFMKNNYSVVHSINECQDDKDKGFTEEIDVTKNVNNVYNDVIYLDHDMGDKQEQEIVDAPTYADVTDISRSEISKIDDQHCYETELNNQIIKEISSDEGIIHCHSDDEDSICLEKAEILNDIETMNKERYNDESVKNCVENDTNSDAFDSKSANSGNSLSMDFSKNGVRRANLIQNEVETIQEKDPNEDSENLSKNGLSENMSVTVDLQVSVKVDFGSSLKARDAELPTTPVDNMKGIREVSEQSKSVDGKMSGYVSEEKENGTYEGEGSCFAEKMAREIVESVLFASQTSVDESACLISGQKNKETKCKNENISNNIPNSSDNICIPELEDYNVRTYGNQSDLLDNDYKSGTQDIQEDDKTENNFQINNENTNISEVVHRDIMGDDIIKEDDNDKKCTDISYFSVPQEECIKTDSGKDNCIQDVTEHIDIPEQEYGGIKYKYEKESNVQENASKVEQNVCEQESNTQRYSEKNATGEVELDNKGDNAKESKIHENTESMVLSLPEHFYEKEVKQDSNSKESTDIACITEHEQSVTKEYYEPDSTIQGHVVKIDESGGQSPDGQPKSNLKENANNNNKPQSEQNDKNYNSDQGSKLQENTADDYTVQKIKVTDKFELPVPEQNVSNHVDHQESSIQENIDKMEQSVINGDDEQESNTRVLSGKIDLPEPEQNTTIVVGGYDYEAADNDDKHTCNIKGYTSETYICDEQELNVVKYDNEIENKIQAQTAESGVQQFDQNFVKGYDDDDGQNINIQEYTAKTDLPKLEHNFVRDVEIQKLKCHENIDTMEQNIINDDDKQENSIQDNKAKTDLSDQECDVIIKDNNKRNNVEENNNMMSILSSEPADTSDNDAQENTSQENTDMHCFPTPKQNVTKYGEQLSIIQESVSGDGTSESELHVIKDEKEINFQENTDEIDTPELEYNGLKDVGKHENDVQVNTTELETHEPEIHAMEDENDQGRNIREHERNSRFFTDTIDLSEHKNEDTKNVDEKEICVQENSTEFEAHHSEQNDIRDEQIRSFQEHTDIIDSSKVEHELIKGDDKIEIKVHENCETDIVDLKQNVIQEEKEMTNLPVSEQNVIKDTCEQELCIQEQSGNTYENTAKFDLIETEYDSITFDNKKGNKHQENYETTDISGQEQYVIKRDGGQRNYIQEHTVAFDGEQERNIQECCIEKTTNSAGLEYTDVDEQENNIQKNIADIDVLKGDGEQERNIQQHAVEIDSLELEQNSIHGYDGQESDDQVSNDVNDTSELEQNNIKADNGQESIIQENSVNIEISEQELIKRNNEQKINMKNSAKNAILDSEENVLNADDEKGSIIKENTTLVKAEESEHFNVIRDVGDEKRNIKETTDTFCKYEPEHDDTKGDVFKLSSIKEHADDVGLSEVKYDSLKDIDENVQNSSTLDLHELESEDLVLTDDKESSFIEDIDCNDILEVEHDAVSVRHETEIRILDNTDDDRILKSDDEMSSNCLQEASIIDSKEPHEKECVIVDDSKNEKNVISYDESKIVLDPCGDIAVSDIVSDKRESKMSGNVENKCTVLQVQNDSLNDNVEESINIQESCLDKKNCEPNDNITVDGEKDTNSFENIDNNCLPELKENESTPIDSRNESVKLDNYVSNECLDEKYDISIDFVGEDNMKENVDSHDMGQKEESSKIIDEDNEEGKDLKSNRDVESTRVEYIAFAIEQESNNSEIVGNNIILKPVENKSMTVAVDARNDLQECAVDSASLAPLQDDESISFNHNKETNLQENVESPCNEMRIDDENESKILGSYDNRDIPETAKYESPTSVLENGHNADNDGQHKTETNKISYVDNKNERNSHSNNDDKRTLQLKINDDHGSSDRCDRNDLESTVDKYVIDMKENNDKHLDILEQESDDGIVAVNDVNSLTVTETTNEHVEHPIDKDDVSKRGSPSDAQNKSEGINSRSGKTINDQQMKKGSRKSKHKVKEEQDNLSDEKSDDDIDDSGQYHPELYTKHFEFSAEINQPVDKDDVCLKEIEKIIDKIETETEREESRNKLANKEVPGYNANDIPESESEQKPTRSSKKKTLKRDKCNTEDTESSESVDDPGQYHPELYEKEWVINTIEDSSPHHTRRKSIDLDPSQNTEMSGLSAVDIELNEDEEEDPVDPNIVKAKLENWIKTERDSSIRKETERFIKEGMPEDQYKIKQRVQAESNEQRRQRDRNIDELERRNSQDSFHSRSMHSSQEGLYQKSRRNSEEDGHRSRHSSQGGLSQISRRNSQEGGYRSRQLSQEEIYVRSRQNSIEGLYDRTRGLGDYSRQGGYYNRKQTTQESNNVRRRDSFKGRESTLSRSLSRPSSREGFYEDRKYSSLGESYTRSRHSSGDDRGDRSSRHGDRSQIYKRRDNYERSESSSSDPMYKEDSNSQRKNVIEKGTLSRHDDLYERRELSSKENLELKHERNERNQSSSKYEEGFMEGRLGRKSDYIEVKKFRKDTKHGLGSDKKKADFLTSAQLKIFCQPPKSPKPSVGHVDMLSVSIERPRNNENERIKNVSNSSIEKMKGLPDYHSESLELEAKKFDVYRYEKQEKKGRKSNLKSDRDHSREIDQYGGQFNESGFSHKDNKHRQIYNRNVDIAVSASYDPNNVIDSYGKNRCAQKHEACLRTKSLVANTNQLNGKTFYSSDPDYIHSRSKYQQNLGGQKCPKSIDGVKDKGRMKIPTNSGETSKDGPLSLTDTFAPMDRGQNDHANLSQSQGKLSDSTTSLNNRQAPAKSPSRQNTLVKQTSVQSNQSEINGERRDDPHGIKFERLKNLEEDDLMAKIKEIIGHLEKLEDYHRGDGMRIQKMLGDMYWDYTHLREMIADCMADNGYAVVSMKMLKTLNGIGIFKNDDVWFPTYYTYNTMWNFSDASSRLAMTLSENDAVRLLTLNCGHKPYIQALHSKNVFYVIKASLSILHNMARNSGMKHLFDENKTSETIMPFMDSEDEMLKILATLTIANIVDEEENKTVIAETGTIHCMVSWIEKAISLPRRRFKGFTPQELTEGLNKLAVNDSNKMKIVEESSLPMFLLMLQHEDVREQSSAARIVWTLSFDKDVRQKLIEKTDLIATLEKLTESTNKSVQQNANGALWIIKGENDISRESKPKGTPTKSHVFLSYSWSDKDTVLQIRDKLRAEGYAIWIDIEKGSAASLEGMANAIENSAVVLVCMSEKYKQNPNCRTESEYTFQLKKDYIPLMLQKKYRPDGWLGFILGAKLYFDFSGKYPFEKSLTGLLKELRGRGQVTPNTTPVGSNDTSDGNMVTSQSLTSYASPGTPVPSNSVLMSMGQEELVKWLRVVKLTECIPAFLEFDGRLLLQLKQMRTEAPEFFYQCLEKRLNMSLIEILKFTRALEELH